jgi:hypothetical protein
MAKVHSRAYLNSRDSNDTRIRFILYHTRGFSQDARENFFVWRSARLFWEIVVQVNARALGKSTDDHAIATGQVLDRDNTERASLVFPDVVRKNEDMAFLDTN